jgi:predicted dehydrogenase
MMETVSLGFVSIGDKVNLGFLGVGDVATRDYLPEIHRLADRVNLAAACGMSEERVRRVARAYKFESWYPRGNFESMVMENGINAVVNLTPMQAHFETNLELLRSGKHVYTEKPLASTAAQARVLQEHAEQRGLKFVCAPSVLLFPQVQYAKSLYESGEIGEVYSARAYGHGGVPPWHGYPSDPSQFFIKGGGPALDMGVYPLHALTGILGPAKHVTAMTSRTQDSFVVPDGPAQGKRVTMEVDDNWHMLLDFGSGRIAYIAANNCVQDSRAPQLELHGLQGTIALNLIDVSAPVEVLRAGNDWEPVQVPHQRAAGPDHILGVEHLVDCIQNDRVPVLSAQHAIHVLDIIEHAARSAAEGRTFAVESSF